MTDYLYEGPCEAGCQHFHGGETKHTPGCGHYPESLTKAFEDQIKALTAERDDLLDALMAIERTYYNEGRSETQRAAEMRAIATDAIEARK